MLSSMTPLDNPFWYALTGPQQPWSLGSGAARRYAPEVAPFAALAEPSAGAWIDLADTLGPEGVGVLFGPEIRVPAAGWTTLRRFSMVQMTFAGDAPPQAPTAEVVPLAASDLPDMQALVRLARPGPFAPRVSELGTYFGVWEGGQLIAMAGERARLPGACEVSAVCVHPDAQRRGLAAAVMASVTEGILARGETPFLHVLEDNPVARSVYRRIGFEERATLQAAVVQPESGISG